MKTDKISNSLEEFGLSSEESETYISLLKTGGSSATALAADIGLKRTTVYPILERLISRGLVTTYEQGRAKTFIPAGPNKLIAMQENSLKALEKIVPLLEGLRGKRAEEFGVRLIRTKKEFQSFYNDILEKYRDREYYIIGSASGFLNVDRDFLIEYRKRRAARNIRVKLLMSHDSRLEEGQNDPKLLRQFKYFPEKYSFKSTIDIYDDKVVIVGSEVKALAVVIAIPPMTDVFRSIFEILWETLP